MDKFNKFFQRLFSSTSLLWKASFALLFVCTGIGILVAFGFKDKLMAAFAGVLVLYGISRFFAFYTEYKSDDDE